jgi:hypothetical protein
VWWYYAKKGVLLLSPLRLSRVLNLRLSRSVGIFIILFAFFTLVNQSTDSAIMRLWWFDHGINEFPIPACFVTADIEPGDEFFGDNNYNGEFFGVTVNDTHHEIIDTTFGTQRIIVIWDGNEIRH